MKNIAEMIFLITFCLCRTRFLYVFLPLSASLKFRSFCMLSQTTIAKLADTRHSYYCVVFLLFFFINL